VPIRVHKLYKKIRIEKEKEYYYDLFPFLKERVIGSLKIVKVCGFVCPSQSDFI